MELFSRRMQDKRAAIAHQIDLLCVDLGIDEPTIEAKIHELRKNESRLKTIKKYRIKSKVQSYDIRDAEDFYGVLELEQMLKTERKSSITQLAAGIR